ncbi:AI-2E family transporter [Aliihoeflea aestuarii]|uniref:AI-2E family transporter n=1 Tax=Aliihoeflea aestuarii TaxID=453840 RepID=UPI0020937460|nr:AI-2E family transporter [Aliihoeflea aestuarii]MCO6390195.1 AI-2E family transporter [Aliihoeflea aestuarii]
MNDATTHSAPAKRTTRASLGWRTATIAGVVLAIALCLFLIIYASSGFLLLFAGILFAVFLDALTRALGYVLPIGRGLRLTIVCIVTSLAAIGFVTSVGVTAVAQTPDLIRTLEREIRGIEQMLQEYNVVTLVTEEITDGNEEGGGEEANDSGSRPSGISDWLPDPSGLFGQVRAAFATTFGVIGNIGVILIIGVFLAAQPQLYRDGAVKLVSVESRPRFGEVMDEVGVTLRFWLMGQFVTMGIIGLVVYAALAVVGMPGAILLGLTAGVLNFIPVLGPILAGIPIVLVAMSQDWWVVGYALAVYCVVQFLEGNVLTPLIQGKAVSLPPAVIMASLVIMGLLFGFVGIILATPFAAVMMVLVKRLYIEDVLGDTA